MSKKFLTFTALGLLAGFAVIGNTQTPPHVPYTPAPQTSSVPGAFIHPPIDKTSQIPSKLVVEDVAAKPVSPAATSDSATDEQLTGDGYILAGGKSYPLRTYKALLTPNDSLPSQWWTDSTNLDTAWDYGPGSYTPLIAIIDTGFALQHEEFAGRWHKNLGEDGASTAEAPSLLNCTDRALPLNAACNLIDDNFDGITDNEAGLVDRENPSRLNCTARGLAINENCNLIDDDANGYIDDVTGWDFSNFDASVQAGETNPMGEGTMHGTLVAGVMAATGNNGKGIAGVNWSARLLPLQALDDDGYGNTLTVARSIYYAANQGADIISVSLGSTAEDPYLRQAITYANSQGSIIVAATGNGGCDCINYPAKYPEVIAVGSVDGSGNPSTFSNFGTELDILAPGENIVAPAWAPAYPTNGYASEVAGTSVAAPYVSGLLGLAKSHLPGATWGELTAALFEQSDRRALTSGTFQSPTLGFGIIRADTLLSRVTTPATPGIRYAFGPISPADTFDSFRVSQCTGSLPTSMLYELSRNGTIRYTASKAALHQGLQSGWTKSKQFPVCIGLPHDQPSTTRTINLLSEIHNRPANKWVP